jgi:hypothetical protein
MTELKFTSPSGETTIKVEGTGRLGTVAPKTKLHIKMDEPVQYETPMTENKEEIEKVKAQIKVLEKKLSFLEELEKTKSPAEEAYNEWYGEYPTNTWQGDVNRWDAFQAGYNAAYEEKAQERGERLHKDVERCVRESVKWCEEHPDKDPLDWLKPQTPEQVADGLKEAFKEAVKQGVVSSSTKSKTLTDLIYDWWEDVFTTHSDWDMETSIENLVDEISLWLPTEHDTNSYKWNECIRMIREKLR